MPDDDKRAAVEFSVTLSSQLISAALAFLAIEGALIVFVLDKRSPEFPFYFFSIAAVLSFVASIVFAGLGINENRNKGFNGDWDVAHGKAKFNAQAICGVAGIAFLSVASFVSGSTSDEQLHNEVRKINAKIESLEATQKTQEKSVASTGSQIPTWSKS